MILLAFFPMFPMRIRNRLPLSCFFLVIFVLLSHQAYARYRYYNLHRGPGQKFKIIGRLKKGEKIKVLKEKAGWLMVRRSNGKVGWISQRLYNRGWRRHKKITVPKAVKVILKFHDIPKACAATMKESLGELQRSLEPVGDDELELVVSALPRLRSFRLFLVIDFNPRYYRRVMKLFSQPTIDLLPYNGCIWALYAYKQSLIRAMNTRQPACQFVKRLSISLVLRKLSGDEVILGTVEDGVYIYFSPVLILKKTDGQCIRVISEEPKKVRLLSAFTLPYPLVKGNAETSRAHEVYRFFRSRS